MSDISELIAGITDGAPLPEAWRHEMADMRDRLAEIDRLIYRLRRSAGCALSVFRWCIRLWRKRFRYRPRVAYPHDRGYGDGYGYEYVVEAH